MVVEARLLIDEPLLRSSLGTFSNVYLSDVSVLDEIINAEAFLIAWQEALRRSRWFARGRTLQELPALAGVESSCKQGKRRGIVATRESVFMTPIYCACS